MKHFPDVCSRHADHQNYEWHCTGVFAFSAHQTNSSVLAWDDLTGMKLEAGKGKEARSKEVQYFRDKMLYEKIPRSQATRKGWKVIQTRWIDINKGDDENPI